MFDWAPFVLIGTIVSFFVTMTWWLAKQFNEVRKLIHAKTEQLERFILDKLEYHERHDDSRFNDVSKRLEAVRDDLWEIRVSNAAKDNLLIVKDK